MKLRPILVCGIVLAFPLSSPAEPPAISALFPPGVQRGVATELTAVGKPGTVPIQAVAEEPGFSALTVSEKGDKLHVETAADCRTGLHWIRFFNADGTAPPVPLWVGTISEIVETEPNNRLEESRKPGPPSLPVVVNGKLEKSGEIDNYPVSLKQGETLVASLGAHQTLGSPMDGVLQILDAQGNVLAQNDDDHGWDPLLTYPIPRDGDYFVRVFAFPAEPNSSINFAGGAEYVYRLTLTTGPFVTRSLPIRLEAATVPLVGGWNLDPVSTGNPDGLPGLHRFRPDPETFAPIQTTIPADPVAPPIAVTGTITDEHPALSLKLNLLKSAPVRIGVIARRLDSLLDPVLNIKDATGKTVKSFDDVSKDDLDVESNWTAPADGVYTFEVVDRYRHAGDRHFAILQVTEERPRYELTLDKDHYAVPADKPLELTVNVNRLAGYKEEFRIRVEGLPEGVTCEPVVSAKEGDSSKKPILKFASTRPTGFQGPIRIVSEGADGSVAETATAALKFGGKRTVSIWLTVPAAPASASAESTPSTEDAKSP